MVIRLARATWLMNRADRMQEGYAVRQAQDVSSGREDRLHAQMMRLKMTEERLRRLAQSVAREHYVTTPADLEKMKNLHQEGELKEMGEIALALFYQLQAPGTGEDGIDPEEKARRVVAQDQGDLWDWKDAPLRPPRTPRRIPAAPGKASKRPTLRKRRRISDIPTSRAAEWEARERPRQLLENILTRQVESCEAQRKAAREGVREGSVALRTRGGNRAHPPQRAAHAANAGFQLSGSPAGHQPAAED